MAELMSMRVKHEDGSLHQLDEWLVIHVLRNPSGWTEDAVRECRLFAAEVLDREWIRRHPRPSQRAVFRAWNPLEPKKND